MEFDTYQKLAAKTDIGTAKSGRVSPGYLYYAVELLDEAGEVMGKIKKHLRDGAPLTTELKKELGDILWPMARLASWFGVSFNDIAESNLRKLFDRLERGVIEGSGDDR